MVPCRRSPPVDYAYQRGWRAEINSFNARLVTMADANAPEMLALLREAGVRHVFIGAKGGTLEPAMFAASANYRLVYTNGAAWVFELGRVRGYGSGG